jgi:hypothetical protein
MAPVAVTGSPEVFQSPQVESLPALLCSANTFPGFRQAGREARQEPVLSLQITIPQGSCDKTPEDTSKIFGMKRKFHVHRIRVVSRPGRTSQTPSQATSFPCGRAETPHWPGTGMVDHHVDQFRGQVV